MQNASDAARRSWAWAAAGVAEIRRCAVAASWFYARTLIDEIRGEVYGTGLTGDGQGDTIGVRYNPYRGKDGRFTTGPRKKKKTKYSPSPRRNPGGLSISSKRYARLCGVFNTKMPNAKRGITYSFRDANHEYVVKADGYGGFQLIKSYKLK